MQGRDRERKPAQRAAATAGRVVEFPKTGTVDAGWLTQRFAALADEDQVRLLVLLTTPQPLADVAAELDIPPDDARTRLSRLVAAGLVEAIPGPEDEHVVDLRALFAMLEELERLASTRRAEHDDLLEETVAAPVRGATGSPAPGAGLIVVRGLGWGRRHPLERRHGRAYTVGRDERADVPIAYDAYASKRHAEFRYDGTGFRLRDLGSRNGTLLNLAPIASGSDVTLGHGDLIGVGRTLLLYWDRPMTRRL